MQQAQLSCLQTTECAHGLARSASPVLPSQVAGLCRGTQHGAKGNPWALILKSECILEPCWVDSMVCGVHLERGGLLAGNLPLGSSWLRLAQGCSSITCRP